MERIGGRRISVLESKYTAIIYIALSAVANSLRSDYKEKPSEILTGNEGGAQISQVGEFPLVKLMGQA